MNWFDTKSFYKSQKKCRSRIFRAYKFMTRGPKPVACHFLAFLLNHILYCICFKILLQYQNILFLTEVMLVRLQQSKNVNKSNKNVGPNHKVFRVIKIIRNHYFIIPKLFRVTKGFILYQIKQTALKSCYNF